MGIHKRFLSIASGFGILILLSLQARAQPVDFDFNQRAQWNDYFHVATPGTHFTWREDGYVSARQGSNFWGAALYDPQANGIPVPNDRFLTETLKAEVAWNTLNVEPGFGFYARVNNERRGILARVHTVSSTRLRLMLSAGRHVAEGSGGSTFFNADLNIATGAVTYSTQGDGGASAASGRELVLGESLFLQLEQTDDAAPKFRLSVRDRTGRELASSGFQAYEGSADFSAPGAIGFFTLAGGGGAQEVRVERYGAGSPLSGDRSMRSSGVVSHGDWAHLFIVDYHDFDGFIGEPGVRYIVDRSKQGGMSRLYWRILAGSAAYHESEIDLDGDGVPDLMPQSQYHFNMPPKSALANDPGHVMLQTPGGTGSIRFKFPDLLNPPVTAELRLRAENLSGDGGLSEYRLSLGTGDLYIRGDGRLAATATGPGMDFPNKEFYVYIRIVHAGDKILAYVNQDASRPLPLSLQPGAETGLSIEKLVEGDAVLRLDSLQITEGAHPPPAKFPYETWDRLSSNYGPHPSWYQVDWLQDWDLIAGFQAEEAAGREHRRMDMPAIYRNDPEAFGPGEDVVSVAMRYAREQNMLNYAWISLCEENHFGNGAMSRFARLNPQFREVDRQGRTWKGRLSFAFPEVRAFKLAVIREMVERYGAEGIMLDFMRRGLLDPYQEEYSFLHTAVWDSGGTSLMGYDARSRDEYRQEYGIDPIYLPNSTPSWVNFRAKYWTDFLREIRAEFPDLKVIPMVFSYDEDTARRGDLLDWGTWVDERLVDEIAFLIDNSNNGRPFLSPFGGQPEPLDSVYSIIRDRKARVGPEIDVIAAVYGYQIKPWQVEQITAYAYEAGADELMWWETTPLEWADYSGRVWDRIRDLNYYYYNSQTSFDFWRFFHFRELVAADGIGVPLAAPAGDNVPNLLKYALGLDPLSSVPRSAPEPEVIEMDGRPRLGFSYRRPVSATDVTYRVEVSDDLIDWSAGPDVTETASVSWLGNGLEEITEVDRQPLDEIESGRRFIRLNVSQP